jgi:asparagine synthase (glutamine-hydrolysing)
MCGIAGYTGPLEGDLLERMNSRLIHRGPDDSGYFHSHDVHIASRRLAIVDPAQGKQPKFSQDRSIVVLMNGEIYNHLELRQDLLAQGYCFESDHSDTEVVAHMFKRDGTACFNQLNGMFAISIYDTKSNVIYLVRDRFGKKPIYYSSNGIRPGLCYASEMNALERNHSSANWNQHSLAWFFSQKAMPLEETMDQRIHQVPPGSYLKYSIQENTISINRYYNWPVASLKCSEPETELDRLLQDAVRLRVLADVKVGAFLSGGLDSSLVVYLASEVSPDPLKTYCLVYDEQVYRKDEDRRFASLIANKYKCEHTEVRLTPAELIEELPLIARHYGQPNAVAVASWFVAKSMKGKIRVALTGDGADEFFGSYFIHRAAAAMDHMDQNVPLADLKYLSSEETSFLRSHRQDSTSQMVEQFGVFTGAEIKELLAAKTIEEDWVLREIQRRYDLLPIVEQRDRLARTLDFDCQNALVTQILNYVDLLSMAHSIEVRSPFLDFRLAEFVRALPSKLRTHNGVTKVLLRKVAERYLPKELVYRPKEGFVEPNVLWLQSHLRDFCREKIDSANFNRLGLLNAEVARKWVREFYSTQNFYVGKKVWALLMFALWEEGVQENYGA